MIIKRFSRSDACYSAVADTIKEIVDNRLRSKDCFSMCLSGGRTPVSLYSILRKNPYKTSIPWDKIDFYFGDERCVPPDNSESNYMAANKFLFEPLAINKLNIFRMEAERNPRCEAAKSYIDLMQSNLKKNRLTYESSKKTYPSFDLLLLGMGPDGHTASLFPEHEALHEKKWVVDVDSALAKPKVPRLTLTLPVINSSKSVLFIINGKEKIKMFEYFLKNPAAAKNRYPAAMVEPQQQLYFFIIE